MRGEITYLGLTTEFTQAEYSFEREYRINGKPSTMVFFNGFTFTIPTNEVGQRFVEEVLTMNEQLTNPKKADPLETEFYKPFIVRIYDSAGYTIRKIELIDAHTTFSRESFSAFQNSKKETETSMAMQMQVLSAIQRINGKALNVFRWHISDYGIEEYKPSVNSTEEKKDKKLRKYQIDDVGNITLCEGKFEDVGDYDILTNLKGEEIKVNNTTILPQFVKKQNFTNTTVSMARVFSEGKKDLAKIFLFATDNSTPEWRMIKTKGNEYLLGTQFDTRYSPSSIDLGLTGDKEIKTSIHSHPDVYIAPGETLFQSEKKSMGYGVQEGVAWGDWDKQLLLLKIMK